jgi:hypothetical protein
MNFKSILALFGVMLFGAGIVMAISAGTGASPTEVTNTRWAGNASGSLTTEGGNITNADISGTTLTDRWAAFWGTISGTINLTDGTYNVYTWAWTPANGGIVCLSTNSSTSFESVTAGGAPAVAAVDTRFQLGPSTVADTAAKTFTTTSCTLPFSDGNITSAANVTDVAGWDTCLVTDGATAAETDFAFCQVIKNSGSSFTGASANYEVMVPTTPGGTTTPGTEDTETYFFYMQLN